MSKIFNLVRSGHGALYVAALVHLGLFVACLVASWLDSRLVAGLNPWIKPMKFCLSIALYSATASVLFGLIDGYEGIRRWLGRIIALMMYTEIVCIVTQAARGVTSHYNIATALDGAIFGLMGIAIAINTVCDAALFGLFLTRPAPSMSIGLLWGVRFGLVLFIAASAEGFVMIMNQAHTVGAPDGGPGLAWVNWSTAHGDLRVAHFLGLHAIQILPLAGLAADSLVGPRVLRALAVSAVTAGYGWLMWWQTKLALAGQPLFKG